METDPGRRWYLTLLFMVYLVLCSLCCLRYLYVDLMSSASVPVLQQALCLAVAIAAGSYFYRARVGHIALTLLTLLTLVAIGRSDPHATVFHLLVLLMLVLPLIWRHKSMANDRVEASFTDVSQPHA